MVKVGLDSGSGYVDFIPDLFASGAGQWYVNSSAQGGHRFWLPVTIAAGTTIGVQAQTNDTTAGSIRVGVIAHGDPTHPELARTGTFVQTFGANTSTTDGVAITPGTTSEGAWAEIGTATDDLFYIDVGVGSRGTLNNVLLHVDIAVGDASTKRVVAEDLYYLIDTTERTVKFGEWGRFVEVAAGEKFYARAQAATAGGVLSVTIHGVGGRYVLPNVSALEGVVTIDGDAAPAGGTALRAYAVRSDMTVDFVGAYDIVSGDGTFSIPVPDTARTYFVVYDNGLYRGVSDLGTAGVSTFQIPIFLDKGGRRGFTLDQVLGGLSF
ncbi:MAG: hypothetical protein ACTHU0_25780 [Kofleriaceae bacterium]